MSSSGSGDDDDFFNQRRSSLPRSSARNAARSDSSRAPPSPGDLALVSSDSEDNRRDRRSKGKGRGVGAPKPLERTVRGKSVTLSSSPERSQGATYTQLDRSSEALRKMAAQKGWEGPPMRILAPVVAVKESPKVLVGSSKVKATSASTSKDTSGTATTSRAQAAPKARKSTTPLPLSPSPPPPAQQPAAPPVSFWNAGSPAAGPSKLKKRVHGVASRQLETLSEQGKKVRGGFVLSEEESIDDSDSGKEERVKPKYESFAAKAKRKREEDLANLKKSRVDKGVGMTTPSGAGKGKSTDPLESCPICFDKIHSSELAQHANNCADRQTTVERKKALAAPLPKPAFRPAALANKAASAPASVARRAPAAAAERQRTPPPAPIPRQQPRLAPVTNTQLIADLDFSPPARRIDAASKGKGRAVVVVVPESDDEVDEVESDYEELAVDEDEWENFDDFAQSKRGRTEEAEEEGGRRGADVDSSPPRGSFYISSLPKATRDGYERLYKTNAPQGDIDAPQKMTEAPPKKAWGGAGRGRGRGGFARRGRGGARRGGKKK